ncbi:hypothetical protein L204_103552 [Cryptococcus depauperatus]|nr:solute carrier family 36 (proton-coupled amino acid transporter) [Cryptococcus depauperatus CBS 7855]
MQSQEQDKEIPRPISTSNTPPIRNIPPRASFSTNTGAPINVTSALGSSHKASPLSGSALDIEPASDQLGRRGRSQSIAKEAVPQVLEGDSGLKKKTSEENWIEKNQASQTAGRTSSALTAQLNALCSTNSQAESSLHQPHSRQASFSRQTLSRSNSQTSIIHQSSRDKERPEDPGFNNIADVTDEAKARMLRRYLVSAEERGQNMSPASGSGTESGPPVGDGGEEDKVGGGTGDESEQFPIPFDAPGGDVTHDLYKWKNSVARPARSASFSHIPLDRSAILDPSLAHIKEPGGFRRNFVVNRAQEQGLAAPNMLRNVIDFLFIYGHFAGEDLNEDDDVVEDEVEEDEEAYPATSGSSRGYIRRAFNDGLSKPGDTEQARRMNQAVQGERAPLLGSTKRTMSRHRRTKSGSGGGTASVTQTVLMLLKGFVGTGVLFMGKAFFNGGILFSSIVMLAIAGISLWSFLLLIQAYMIVPGSFGDIGGELYGKNMRYIILTSIAVSQIGFVAAYTIFIAENLQAFVMAVSSCKTFIPVKYLIFAQLVVFMPLSMVRNLAKLSGTALIADAFILIGIIYIGGNEISVLSKSGVADVQLFNPTSYPLLIGTAVFAFEGIGLVIPITNSMRQPEKFPKVLSAVMFVIAILFAGAGVMSYAAYGSEIQTVVLVNLPQDDKFVQAVQFLYSIAILLSSPLQLFPAVRIMENGLFAKAGSGKYNPSVKWQKNVFRSAMVVFCSLISWAGSSELDKFVSLIGSFACIPLCFIYPPMLHLKACARTRKARLMDLTLIIFGSAVGIFTTVQTLRSLFVPSGEKPKFGACDPTNK